jgi:hypothetical protein
MAIVFDGIAVAGNTKLARHPGDQLGGEHSRDTSSRVSIPSSRWA